MAFDASQKKQNGAFAQSDSDPYTPLTDPGQAATSSAPLSGSGGATPTGYVNFGDYFNANGAAAAQGAQQLQSSEAKKATGAQQGLNQAQTAFTGAVNAGTPQGPSTQDFWTASGYQKTPSNVGAAKGSAQPAQKGIAYGKNGPPASPPVANQPPMGWSPGGGGGTDADNARWAAGAANAHNGYTGPNSLSDADTYSQLASDTKGASDEANALASGNSGIAGALQGSANTSADASLLGAAGRQGFVNSGQKYGGMSNTLDAANTASQGQSDTARQMSDNALQQYGLLANQETNTQDAIADKEAANYVPVSSIKGVSNPITSGVQGNPNAPHSVSQWIRDIGGWLSPIDDIAHATGNKGPIDYGTDYFEKTYGPIGGTFSQQDQTLNPNAPKYTPIKNKDGT